MPARRVPLRLLRGPRGGVATSRRRGPLERGAPPCVAVRAGTWPGAVLRPPPTLAGSPADPSAHRPRASWSDNQPLPVRATRSDLLPACARRAYVLSYTRSDFLRGAELWIGLCCCRHTLTAHRAERRLLSDSLQPDSKIRLPSLLPSSYSGWLAIKARNNARK